MKLRTSQLVCLALLLTTLSYVGAPALAQTQLQAQLQMQVTYLRVLGDYSRILTAANRQKPPANRRSTSLTTSPRPVRSFTLKPASMAAVQTPWTMRPPSAQYASLQAFTASSRPRA
jgi:hypothetical protein